MSLVIVTGSAGLIGSETVRFFAEQGLEVIGIDNDMRADFFGSEASTEWNRQQLEQTRSNTIWPSAFIRLYLFINNIRYF